MRETEIIPLLVVATIVSGLVMGFSMLMMEQSGKILRMETVEMMGDRIESAAYALNSVERGKLEMDLRSEEGYRIYEKGGEKYINYSMEDDHKASQLESHIGPGFDVEISKDHEPVDTICLNKTSSGLGIWAGECEWTTS